MQLKIEYLNKNELKPYENNTKIHTDQQIAQIRESILAFGFNDPVAVWKDNIIIEGHGRLLAAMQIDALQLIPVIRLDSLTDQQRKAYAIVHNALVLSTGFDIDLLRQELENIQTIDMQQFDFTIKEDLKHDDEFKQMFLDEPIEKKPKQSTIVCPCCGREIKREELQYLD